MSKTYQDITATGAPTGLGLVKGPESAPTANLNTPNRATKATANDARFGSLGNTPDPCYCGCCNLEKSAN